MLSALISLPHLHCAVFTAAVLFVLAAVYIALPLRDVDVPSLVEDFDEDTSRPRLFVTSEVIGKGTAMTAVPAVGGYFVRAKTITDDEPVIGIAPRDFEKGVMVNPDEWLFCEYDMRGLPVVYGSWPVRRVVNRYVVNKDVEAGEAVYATDLRETDDVSRLMLRIFGEGAWETVEEGGGVYSHTMHLDNNDIESRMPQGSHIRGVGYEFKAEPCGYEVGVDAAEHVDDSTVFGVGDECDQPCCTD